MSSLFNDPEYLARVQAFNLEKGLEEYNVTVESALYKPKAPIGSYGAVTGKATIERNFPGKHCITDAVYITFSIYVPTSDNTFKTVEINQPFWKSNSKGSDYYKNLKELLGKDPRQGFSLKDLMGIPCEVEITHNKTDAGTFSNVSSIKRVDINPMPDQFVI